MDAIAERELLLGLTGASNAAAELRRRAAETGYRLTRADDTRAR